MRGGNRASLVGITTRRSSPLLAPKARRRSVRSLWTDSEKTSATPLSAISSNNGKLCSRRGSVRDHANGEVTTSPLYLTINAVDVQLSEVRLHCDTSSHRTSGTEAKEKMMETEERLALLEARVAVLESALTSLASVGQAVRSAVALQYDAVPLSALDLRPRSVCVLMHSDIRTVGQLLRMRESDFLRLVGVGRAIVREVQDCLRAQGLHLLSE